MPRVTVTYDPDDIENLDRKLANLEVGHIITVRRVDGCTITGPVTHPSGNPQYIGELPLTHEYANGGRRMWVSVEWDEPDYPEWMDAPEVTHILDRDDDVWKRVDHDRWMMLDDDLCVSSQRLYERYQPLTPLMRYKK